jgi:hypothetical protein
VSNVAKYKTIPIREPEVIASEARKKWHGNSEKVATTSIKELNIDGVNIISRYCQAHEFELMRDMMLTLPPQQRAAVAAIFCDSKCTFCFSVTLRHWNRELATKIGKQLEQVALQQSGGHNGITVAAVDREDRFFGDLNKRINIDPDWNDAES